MSISKLFDLSDQTAIVTGSGKGIGEGIARLLSLAGANVVVSSRTLEDIQKVSSDINSVGGSSIPFVCDVTDDAQVDALAKCAIQNFGKIDIWINNVGGSSGRTPLKELSREDWDQTIALTLTSVFIGCQVAAQNMTTGSIVNISSRSSWGSVPNNSHYGAAKAGVINLTKGLAMSWAPNNINVNCIAPGLTATEGVASWLPEKTKEDGTSVPPLLYPPDPEHVADLALFLASELSAHISGELFPIRSLTELA